MKRTVLLLGALMISSTVALAQNQTIDFEGIATGTIVTEVFGDGGFGPITVTARNNSCTNQGFGPLDAAVIFDSNNPSGADFDLGSPNEDFGGPGIDNDGDPNMGGNAGSPFQNDTAQNNILIIHEDCQELDDAATGGTPVADPDDFDGPNTIELVFPAPVTVFSRLIMDQETSEQEGLELYGEGDVLLATFDSPAVGDNGVTLAETGAGGTAGVVRMFFSRNGSRAIDDIVFLPPPDEPGDPGCTYTQGFWKNHEDEWPVDQLTLGGVTYSQSELLDILNAAVKGDKTISMAHQLIAAKLNVANGADDTDVADAIADADAWLADHGGVGSDQNKWDGGEEIKDTLDYYNNGVIGPGHCDDVDGSAQTIAQRANLTAATVVTEFGLSDNYPNPFRNATLIEFALEERANVRLSVYDMLGREIAVLAEGQFSAGHYARMYTADKKMPAGLYLYQLQTPTAVSTKTMLLVK